MSTRPEASSTSTTTHPDHNAMAIGPGPSPRARLSIGRALALFVLYVFVFAAGGGLGAGVPALLYELVTQRNLMRGDHFMLYAIMFGVTGFIAYRLAQRVVEGGDGRL